MSGGGRSEAAEGAVRQTTGAGGADGGTAHYARCLAAPTTTHPAVPLPRSAGEDCVA
jgi:hypothetical protein